VIENTPVAHRARQEQKPVARHGTVEPVLRVQPAHGSPVLVDHMRGGHKHGRPALLPGAHAQIEVFHVGRFITLVETMETKQPLGLEQAAAAAAVQDVSQVLSLDRHLATDGEIGQRGGGHDNGLARLLASEAGGREDLRRGAKESRHLLKGLLQMTEEPRRNGHIIVEQADVRESGSADSDVYGTGKTQRLGVAQHRDGGKRATQEIRRAVFGTVIDYDDLTAFKLVQYRRQHMFQKIASVARRDHHGNPGRSLRSGDSHRSGQTVGFVPGEPHSESDGAGTKRAEARHSAKQIAQGLA